MSGRGLAQSAGVRGRESSGRPGARVRWRGGAPAVLIGLALLGGWGLRLYRLGAQSFWYDEGTSITVAPRDVPTILASAAADIHPPLYYLLLHVWVALAGVTEYAARFPSALVGTLTVALVARLGRDLLPTPGGLAAALLAATAPLPIWYSQEARMYALATCLGALATLLLLRALRRPRPVLWIVYALTIAATLYSHYFAAAVPLAHAVAVGLWLLTAPRRRLGTALAFAGSGLAAGVLFVPWLLRTFGQLTGWPATSEPFGVRTLVTRTLLLFARGYGADRLDPTVALPIAVGIGLGLLWLLWRRRDGGILAGSYFVVPLAAMMIVSLSRPFFHPKFVLLVAPAAELLLAAGAVGVGWAVGRTLRASAAAPAGALIVVVALGLWRADGVRAEYVDPTLARDDYRGLARTIAQAEQPGDAIVLNAPGQVEIFDFYYRGDAPRVPLPETRPPDPARTAASLAALAERYARVWLVLWAQGEADPGGSVERWLDERMYKASSRWFGGVRAALYLNPRSADVRPRRYEVGARFGDLAELAAVELIDPRARAGEAVPVALRWRALGASDTPYVAFVHLLGPGDYLWGQHDGAPAGGGRPTTGWRAGEEIEDRHGLPILAGTPPGQYQLEIGLYRSDTGARLPVRDRDGKEIGDRLLVGPIEVSAGRNDPPALASRIDARVGTAWLRGAELRPLGRDAAPPEVGPGELVQLTLYWQGSEERDRPSPVELELRLRGPSQASYRLPVAQGRYPADGWGGGEWVRDPYKLPTTDLLPGRYAVEVQGFDRAGRAVDRSVVVGELAVR